MEPLELLERSLHVAPDTWTQKTVQKIAAEICARRVSAWVEGRSRDVRRRESVLPIEPGVAAASGMSGAACDIALPRPDDKGNVSSASALMNEVLRGGGGGGGGSGSAWNRTGIRYGCDTEMDQ